MISIVLPAMEKAKSQNKDHHIRNVMPAPEMPSDSDLKSTAHLNAAAQAASTAEHNLSFLEAIKTHRRAVLWSVLVSTSIVMEGYDIVLIGSLFAQPAVSTSA